jgi:iron(III) transport system substrate-binding protein
VPNTTPRRRLLLRVLTAAGVAAATALLAACGFSTDDSSDAGPPEPETAGITLYAGRIPASVGGAIDAYEAKADRDVETRFATSPDLAAAIIEEGGNSPADVFFAQDSSALEAVTDRGLLAKLPPDILRMVPPEFRDEQGTWVGVSGRARVIAYNEEVPRSELPDSPLDLADPRWRGRVGWAPVTESMQAYVTALRLEYGDERTREWLEAMEENDVQDYPNNVALRDAIAAGEVDVGLLNHYYVAQAIAAEGEDYPVDLYFPPDDFGSLVLVTAIGVLESSDRKDEAFDFVREMLSPEAQEFFTASSKEYPLAVDLEPDPSLTVPLDEIPAPEGELTDLEEIQATIELMREAGAL